MAANDIRRRWATWDKSEYELWVEGVHALNPEIPVKISFAVKKAKLPNEVLEQIHALVSEYDGEMEVVVVADLSAVQGKLRVEPATLPMFTDADFREAIKGVPPAATQTATATIRGPSQTQILELFTAPSVWPNCLRWRV